MKDIKASKLEVYSSQPHILSIHTYQSNFPISACFAICNNTFVSFFLRGQCSFHEQSQVRGQSERPIVLVLLMKYLQPTSQILHFGLDDKRIVASDGHSKSLTDE